MDKSVAAVKIKWADKKEFLSWLKYQSSSPIGWQVAREKVKRKQKEYCEAYVVGVRKLTCYRR